MACAPSSSSSKSNVTDEDGGRSSTLDDRTSSTILQNQPTISLNTVVSHNVNEAESQLSQSLTVASESDHCPIGRIKEDDEMMSMPPPTPLPSVLLGIIARMIKTKTSKVAPREYLQNIHRRTATQLQVMRLFRIHTEIAPIFI